MLSYRILLEAPEAANRSIHEILWAKMLVYRGASSSATTTSAEEGGTPGIGAGEHLWGVHCCWCCEDLWPRGGICFSWMLIHKVRPSINVS